ncbi:hypothetical protein B0H11DRAFT_2261134 [Mycena galericulata]|nr:hypothetical protein B0H11DRAFT_2261134 [Mycena galericulata]
MACTCVTPVHPNARCEAQEARESALGPVAGPSRARRSVRETRSRRGEREVRDSTKAERAQREKKEKKGKKSTGGGRRYRELRERMDALSLAAPEGQGASQPFAHRMLLLMGLASEAPGLTAEELLEVDRLMEEAQRPAEARRKHGGDSEVEDAPERPPKRRKVAKRVASESGEEEEAPDAPREPSTGWPEGFEVARAPEDVEMETECDRDDMTVRTSVTDAPIGPGYEPPLDRFTVVDTLGSFTQAGYRRCLKIRHPSVSSMLSSSELRAPSGISPSTPRDAPSPPLFLHLPFGSATAIRHHPVPLPSSFDIRLRDHDAHVRGSLHPLALPFVVQKAYLELFPPPASSSSVDGASSDNLSNPT